jgi:TRAP transporter TAXI family solute receptor
MKYFKPTLMLAAGLGLATFNSPTSFAAEQLSIAVGTLGGTMGRIGAGLADVVNKNQTAVKYSVSPGGGRANPARVSTGGADFGYSFSSFTATALAGKTPFKKAYPNLRVIARFFESCYHQYVAKDVYDAGIQTWEDIVKSPKPLKIALVKKGTSSEYTGSLIVKHLGSSYEKMAARGDKQTFSGTGANSRAIRSGQIDIYFHNSGDPNGAGIQAALGRPLTFLRMTDNIKTMLDGHGYAPCVIPGGIYKGNDKDTHSMGLSGVLLTTDKMKADRVYDMLKIIAANKKTLGAVHKIYKTWTPAFGAKVGKLPLHAGAERFYKEVGAIN